MKSLPFFKQMLILFSVLWLFSLLTFSIPFTQAASSTIVISEVQYDPSGTEPGSEWIELYNLGGTTLDLSTYKLGDEETFGGGEGMYIFPSGFTMAPGQVVVIANKAADYFALFGTKPDLEFVESDATVPNMTKYSAWASGSVALSNSGDEVLLLDGNDALVDAVSWGSSTFAFNPAAPDVPDGHSLERNPADNDTDSAADWIDQATPNPGSVVTAGNATPTPLPTATPTPTATPQATPTPAPGCGKTSTYTAIWEIQGSGNTSPLVGQTLSNVRGIVTADFQSGTGGPSEPRGFFIQAHEPDCDANTSDGIWVYTSTSVKNISVGDLVELDGAVVVEYQGPASFRWDETLTELDCRTGCTVTTIQANYGLPPVEEYDPPADDALAAAYNEAREGMLVQVSTDATVIAPVNQYNEMVMVRGTGADRLHHDAPPFGHRIIVDGDGVSAARCGVDGLGYIKTFDTIVYNPAAGQKVYGPLTYNFNTYKIQQDDDTACVVATAGNDTSYDPADNPAPADDANTLTVATMNAWNFFDTTDDPYKSDTVLTQADYDRKSTKMAQLICNTAGLNRPLIIGLQEIENSTVLAKLANDIAATCGVTYEYYTIPGPDNRSIDVGVLTRADRVTVLSVREEQGCSATNWGIDYETGDQLPAVTCSGSTPYYLFNRPPLHLEAQITLGGAPRTIHVIVNHFKSKLSSASCSTADCTDRRVEQAQHVDTLVDTLLAADPNANIVVLGDFNDYYNSAPLDVLDKTSGVLTNVWDDAQGPPSTGQGSITRYSYIHDGISQTFDHILVSDALNALPRILSPRRVNADWPGSHISDTSMYRFSDHDPVLVAFVFGTATPTPTPTPTFTPTPTPTPTATPTPSPASTLHVGDLDGNSTRNKRKWSATITITLHDSNETPVANALVSGVWSGATSGTASCTTDAAGQCTVSVSNLSRKQKSVTFSVTDISHATLSYNALDNHDPDGSSDGTSITIASP